MSGRLLAGRGIPLPLLLAFVALAAPWILLWILWRALRALWRLPALVRRLRAHTAPELRCPVGHVNSPYGRWQCACGFSQVGHAFAPCGNCSAVTGGWIECARCGLGVKP